jgi:hypothetical protein
MAMMTGDAQPLEQVENTIQQCVTTILLCTLQGTIAKGKDPTESHTSKANEVPALALSRDLDKMTPSRYVVLEG